MLIRIAVSGYDATVALHWVSFLTVSCLLPQTKSMKLYEACLTLLQVYSKNNQSRKRSDATAEEDQYQDLLLIMELLTNLLSKEFIDFSDTGELSACLCLKYQ